MLLGELREGIVDSGDDGGADGAVDAPRDAFEQEQSAEPGGEFILGGLDVGGPSPGCEPSGSVPESEDGVGVSDVDGEERHGIFWPGGRLGCFWAGKRYNDVNRPKRSDATDPNSRPALF